MRQLRLGRRARSAPPAPSARIDRAVPAAKTISPVDGLQLQPNDQLVLAATCCLPLLEIGAAGWRGWSQLIVYPDAFRVQRTHMDAAGVMHAWDDTLIGEAWEQVR